MDGLGNAGSAGGQTTGMPDGLVGDGLIGAAGLIAGEQPAVARCIARRVRYQRRVSGSNFRPIISRREGGSPSSPTAWSIISDSGSHRRSSSACGAVHQFRDRRARAW